MDSNALDQLLRDNAPANKFVPYSHVNTETDTLTVYFEADADYSKRLSDHVTLYLSLDTDEIVGCRVKGIAGLLEDLPNYLTVNHNGVELSLIFLAFRGGADEDVSDQINDLAREAHQRQMVLQPV